MGTAKELDRMLSEMEGVSDTLDEDTQEALRKGFACIRSAVEEKLCT